jgi:hypothetical protein
LKGNEPNVNKPNQRYGSKYQNDNQKRDDFRHIASQEKPDSCRQWRKSVPLPETRKPARDVLKAHGHTRTDMDAGRIKVIFVFHEEVSVFSMKPFFMMCRDRILVELSNRRCTPVILKLHCSGTNMNHVELRQENFRAYRQMN